MARRISIFGATGSIGQNTLDLIRRGRGYKLVALTGASNILQLAADAREFGPEVVVTADAARADFEQLDREYLRELAGLYDADIPIQENKAFVERVREMVAERDDRIAQAQATEEDIEDIATGKAVEG